MIIPIRCFTCGKVLADKHEFYKKEIQLKKGNNDPSILDVNSKTIQKTVEGEILDKLGLTRYCCRRVMLTSTDLIELI